jgi:hypothetical protein
MDMNLNSYKKRKRTKFEQYNLEGNLICYKCNEYKPETEFDINPNRWFRNNRDYRCKECKKQQRLKRLITNRGKQDLDRLLLERYLGAKDRAKNKNLDFNLTLDFLKYLWNKQCGKCALSNIDMTSVFFSGRVPTNVSIDRIDSNKGYIMDNIQLVCMACNQMKNDLTKEELYKFCKNIVETYESKNKENS